MQTLALILFLFPLAYSPGPGNLTFAANAARFGFRATIPATIGYHLATWIGAAVIGMGLSLQGAGLARALQLAGAGYVLWLAWGLARSDMGKAEARPMGFAGGAALLVLNPKAYVIMGLMFTQFPGDRAWILWVTTVFTLNNLIAFVAWSLLGARLGPIVQRSRVLLAILLAAVALWMALRP